MWGNRKLEINRPGDAAKYLQEVVEYVCSRHGPAAGDIFRAQQSVILPIDVSNINTN